MQGMLGLSIVGWLGCVRERYWIAIWSVAYMCALLSFLVVLVSPAFDSIVNSSGEGMRIEELEQRKLSMKQILARLDEEREAESEAVGTQSAFGVDNVLELIQRGAQSARVRVTSLTSEPLGQNSHEERVGAPYRFSVHGSYFALGRFIETVSQTTSGLLLAELTIHNRVWPDFSGSLDAEITLRVAKGP